MNDVIKRDFDPKADWYHGTDVYFQDWKYPPPPKPGENAAVPHTAVFLTSQVEFAEGAGSGLCRAKLLSSARVLDATQPSPESTKLRKLVGKNRLASLSLHVQTDHAWTEGWCTGEVLRFTYMTPMVEIYLGKFIRMLQDNGLPRSAAETLAKHNMTRGWIELICSSARTLGVNAIFGHEVDQLYGAKIARPWLAVLTPGSLSRPEWVRRPVEPRQSHYRAE